MNLKVAAALILIALVGCQHRVLVVEDGGNQSVVAAIERYQLLGAPGEAGDHEVMTKTVAIDHASAMKAFRESTLGATEIGELKKVISKSPVGRTKTGYFYTVATSSKHVFLLFIQANTSKVVWIALM